MSISVVCAVVIVLTPLLHNNFNAAPVLTKWGEPISWKNFIGIPKFFSPYDAGISSTIYLEYDSSARNYIAYAAQDNNYSWVRPGSTNLYGLNHEQYHFNITEIHARMLNNFVRENPDLNEKQYTAKLNQFKYDLSKMQDAYDEETNHSIHRDLQRWWEYRIDSLLLVHALDSGLVTDYYSGAQAFFPAKPLRTSNINSSKIPYRYAGVAGYDMFLMFIVFQNENYNDDLRLVEVYARTTYEILKLPIRSVSVKPTLDDELIINIIAEDTISGSILYDTWRGHHPYLYRVSAQIPKLAKDTTGYHRIAQSFLNSFRVVNTDKYWISKTKQDTTGVVNYDRAPIKSKKCYTLLKEEAHGFYRGPMQYDDRSLIAYDISDDSDSLIQEYVLYADDKLIKSGKLPDDILYVTSANAQLKPSSSITVGYIPKNDSTAGCKMVYNQKINIR